MKVVFVYKVFAEKEAPINVDKITEEVQQILQSQVTGDLGFISKSDVCFTVKKLSTGDVILLQNDTIVNWGAPLAESTAVLIELLCQ